MEQRRWRGKNSRASFTGLLYMPDKQRSFQRILGVCDSNLSFRKTTNRRVPFGSKLLHRDSVVCASVGLFQFYRFRSIRVSELQHDHLHKIPVQVTIRIKRGVSPHIARRRAGAVPNFRDAKLH